MQRIHHLKYLPVLAILFIVAACEKEEYKLPDPKTELSNDAIKRTLGPNIVTLPIDFVYAMAIPAAKGKLVSAEVEASIPGAAGTKLDNNSYYTNGSGVDVPVLIGSPSTTTGNKTTVTFTKDTFAAALRYSYIIPEEARGKQVSFVFSATASDGSRVTFNLGPYQISKMDIIRNLAVSNNVNSYISISNLAVYNATAAAANADKVDLVYLYRTTPANFTHALVSPAANPVYLPGVTLPAGVNKSTKVQKTFNLQDYNLARLQYGIYIDDKDFQEIDLTNAPNYALNLRAEAGAWVETADGKYRAYIYLNSVNSNGSAVISILRYAL